MVLKDCIRVFLFIINTVTVIFGFAITAVGIYCISKSRSDPFNDMETGNLVGFIVFTLFIGLFVLTLGLLGVFGSITQSPRMMNVYVGLIIIVLVLELVLLIGSLASKTKIVETAKEGFKEYVSKYHQGEEDGDVVKAVDAIQRNLKCCGYDGPADYAGDIPPSCCQDEEEPASYESCVKKPAEGEGCNTPAKLPRFIGDVIHLFAVIIAFAVVLDVVSMAGAFYVRKNSPKYDHIS